MRMIEDDPEDWRDDRRILLTYAADAEPMHIRGPVSIFDVPRVVKLRSLRLKGHGRKRKHAATETMED